LSAAAVVVSSALGSVVGAVVEGVSSVDVLGSCLVSAMIKVIIVFCERSVC